MENPPRDPRIPDLVSLKEAAEIMGVTRQAAHKMVMKGQLRGARIGTTWAFRRAAAERLRGSQAVALSRTDEWRADGDDA